MRTVVVKRRLFSYAFHLTIVDLFREFSGIIVAISRNPDCQGVAGFTKKEQAKFLLRTPLSVPLLTKLVFD